MDTDFSDLFDEISGRDDSLTLQSAFYASNCSSGRTKKRLSLGRRTGAHAVRA